jgi:hypothetical protein
MRGSGKRSEIVWREGFQIRSGFLTAGLEGRGFTGYGKTAKAVILSEAKDPCI